MTGIMGQWPRSMIAPINRSEIGWTGMKKWEVPVWRIGEAGGSALNQAALQKKNYGTVSQSWNVKIKTYRWRMTC